MGFKENFEKWTVPAGKIGVVWLGQAGFMFKLPDGRKIILDPYLTDYTYKAIGEPGFIRMTAPLFAPDEIGVDYIFSSHEHPDHLDIDALPGLSGGNAKVFANMDTVNAAKAAGLEIKNLTVIKTGDVVEQDGFKVYAMKADHGELAPNAMGFIFDFGYIKVYYSGDTCYNKEVLSPAVNMHPEVALLPINGAFGNLNAVDAALLARDLGSKVCIPHHFWTFPAHNAVNGDPMTAVKYFPEIAPGCELKLTTPGALLEF